MKQGDLGGYPSFRGGWEGPTIPLRGINSSLPPLTSWHCGRMSGGAHPPPQALAWRRDGEDSGAGQTQSLGQSAPRSVLAAPRPLPLLPQAAPASPLPSGGAAGPRPRPPPHLERRPPPAEGQAPALTGPPPAPALRRLRRPSAPGPKAPAPPAFPATGRG